MSYQGQGPNYGPQFKPAARHDSGELFNLSIKKRHIPWIVAFFGIGGVSGFGGLWKAWQVEDKAVDAASKTQRTTVRAKAESDFKQDASYRALVDAVDQLAQQNTKQDTAINAGIEKDTEQDKAIEATVKTYARRKKDPPKPVVTKAPKLPPSPDAAALIAKAKRGIDASEKGEESEGDIEQHPPSEEDGEAP